MIKLRESVAAKDAAAELRRLARDCRNLLGSAHRDHARIFRDAYLGWADIAELVVRNLTLDQRTRSILHTERYWHIRNVDLSSARPLDLINREIEVQAEALDGLAHELEVIAKRLSETPGWVTVLDTNTLLHYRPIEQIDWPREMNHDPIRLVIPLRVIEELDAKKWARRSDLADRARGIIRGLDKILTQGPGPAEVRPSVSVEVLVDDGPRSRPEDADEEILNGCREIAQLTGRAVTLVTADTAMRLRASARDISVLTLGDRLLRVPPTSREGVAL